MTEETTDEKKDNSPRKEESKEQKQEGKKKEEKEKIEKLEERIEELENELEEYEDDLLRKHADFENYKKQLDKEKEQFTKAANEKLVKDLLEVIDTMEIAIKNIREQDPEIAEGVENIYKKFVNILQNHGLKRIETVGRKFDPYYHEACMREESDKPEDTILEEFQTGYMLNNKIIRYSKVKVSK